MKKWPEHFPRFNNLYQRSDQTHSDNYFHALGKPPVALSTVVLGDLREKFFEWYEERLERLAEDAWEQLAGKTLPYVCRRDQRRGWTQLWNHLNESLGYVLLANRGYSGIQFIDCGDERSPDLIGESASGRALVEVKTVNCSEDEINTLNESPPVVRDVGYGLTVTFKEKLRKTIDIGRSQLCQRGETGDKRIVLLVVSLDSDFKFVGQNYKEVQEFVAGQQSPNLEVVLQLIS